MELKEEAKVVKQLEEEERRTEAARRVFRLEEDKLYYGYSERVIEFMRLSASSYKAGLRVST